MHHQQIAELNRAIELLEANPTYATLPQVAACLSPGLWKLQVSASPIEGDNHPYWLHTKWERDPEDHERLDQYAAALDDSLATITTKENQQARRVLGMLKTWLSQESTLPNNTVFCFKGAYTHSGKPYPPLAPKPPKVRKAYTLRRPTKKRKAKTAWAGAKSFAKLATTLVPKDDWKIDTQRCLYVTVTGVLARGNSTLLFVEGDTDQEPGVYNAKTGEAVTEPTKMPYFYTDIFCVDWGTPVQKLTCDAQKLLDALRFVSVMGDIGVWKQGGDSITLTTESDVGNAKVQLLDAVIYTHTAFAQLPTYTTTFNIKEAAKAVTLMPGEVTVSLYPDGTIQFQGANATALCLPITKEEK